MDFGRGSGSHSSVPHLPDEHPLTAELLTDGAEATRSNGRDENAAISWKASTDVPSTTQRRDADRRYKAKMARELELFVTEPPEVRIGLSTWGDKAYRGVLYPETTTPKDFLAHYGKRFSTVELSATFYGLPDEERLLSWRNAVPSSFRFLAKVSQSITHRGGLAEAQQGLRGFMERLSNLGDRRGPVLLQMPPRFAPNAIARDRLAAAVAILQRQAAVELRHPDWFRDDAEAGGPPAATILRESGTALAVTDTIGARQVVHSLLTSPVLLLRFVAVGRQMIDDPRIDEWNRRIADWLRRGLREVYITIHHDDPVWALRLAQRFSEGLDDGTARVFRPTDLHGTSEPSAVNNGESSTTGLNSRSDLDVASSRSTNDGQLSLF